MKTRGARPLYIDARTRANVAVDGPALRLDQRGWAPRWFPLGRISRVVVAGDAQWQTAAIAACLDRGIPIVVSASGRGIAGWIVPRHARPRALENHLHELAERPDWQADIDDWHRAEERRAILALLRKIRMRARDLRPDMLWSRVLTFLDQGWCGVTADRIERLLPLVIALVLERLQAAGVPPETLATTSRASLVHRFWEILRWDVAGLLRGAGYGPGLPMGRRDAADFLAGNGPAIEHRLQGLTQRLDLFLAEEGLRRP